MLPGAGPAAPADRQREASPGKQRTDPFEKAATEAGGAELQEGCPGGKHLPSRRGAGEAARRRTRKQDVRRGRRAAAGHGPLPGGAAQKVESVAARLRQERPQAIEDVKQDGPHDVEAAKNDGADVADGAGVDEADAGYEYERCLVDGASSISSDVEARPLEAS